MRYWYDTEFIESGPEHPIELISIGIVCEDGREYYGQSVEFEPKKASDWVKENVFPHLVVCPWAHITVDMRYPHVNDIHYHKGHGQCVDQHRGFIHNCPWRTREQLKRDVQSFFNPSDGIELWGYYSAYDHVVFCQLFGTMMDLPEGYPMYTRDLKQWCDQLGNPRLPEQGKGEHNALADARWNKQAWEFLQNYPRTGDVLLTSDGPVCM